MEALLALLARNRPKPTMARMALGDLNGQVTFSSGSAGIQGRAEDRSVCKDQLGRAANSGAAPFGKR